MVNDGSTCAVTKQILETPFVKSKATVINNALAQGLPSARNIGIQAARGEYILPIDADDKIAPEYIELASAVLTNNPEVGIVSGDGEYFGARRGKTLFPEFSEWRMLADNCIVSIAMFRKADWETVGGYCSDFREGWEDWDFYLSLLERGIRYRHLEKTVYYYRRHSANMTQGLDKRPEVKSHLYRLLVERHSAFFEKHFREALLFLTGERIKQRHFSQRGPIALCRKLLRFLGKY